MTLPFSGLSAKCLFSQRAGTKDKSKRFILEFKLYLVVFTITPKPVPDVAFLQYEILLAIVFTCVLQNLPSTVKRTQIQVISNRWLIYIYQKISGCLLILYFTRR